MVISENLILKQQQPWTVLVYYDRPCKRLSLEPGRRTRRFIPLRIDSIEESLGDGRDG